MTRLVFSAAHGAYAFDLADCQVSNIMFNFNDWRAAEKVTQRFWLEKGKAVRVYVDSGAFTDWQKKTHVPLTARENREYLERYARFAIDFYSKYSRVYEEIYFVSFDKIPGKFKIRPSIEEVREAELVSLSNFLRLRKLGVPNLIPVIHQYENPNLVKRYERIMGSNAYICFSPANDRGNAGRIEWLDRVFAVKSPSTQVHGLGVWGKELLLRYNWDSTDARTWALMPEKHNFQMWQFGEELKCSLGSRKEKLHRTQKYGLERVLPLYRTRRQKIRDSIKFYQELEVKVNTHWNRRTK